MSIKLIKLFNDLRASYWFVPICMVIGSVLLAVAMRWLDGARLASTLPILPWIRASGTEGARTLLTVIATGVLGVAGVTFSITIVAVSFASSNFGPRLIGNFMRDRGSQFTLGTFIGTFVYCLLILSSVHGEVTLSQAENIDAFVPYFSIILSLVLMLCSICVLIYFIHHIAETINIENIIADIGMKLQRRINTAYPDPTSVEPLLDNDFVSSLDGKLSHSITAGRIGYVQAIDHEKLISIATDNHLLVSLHYRPGDFLTTHDNLMSVWHETEQCIPEAELCECVVTGPQRTEHQNMLFLVEQLGEVITRALSPGINDPFTAISCLNWFKTALADYVVEQKDKADHNEWHRRRVQLLPISFDRVTAVMFDRTRPYIITDSNVVLHTMALLAECATLAGPGEHRDVLLHHLHQLHRSAIEQFGSSVSGSAITERFAEAKRIVADGIQPGLERQHTDWFGGSA